MLSGTLEFLRSEQGKKCFMFTNSGTDDPLTCPWWHERKPQGGREMFSILVWIIMLHQESFQHFVKGFPTLWRDTRTNMDGGNHSQGHAKILKSPSRTIWGECLIMSRSSERFLYGNILCRTKYSKGCSLLCKFASFYFHYHQNQTATNQGWTRRIGSRGLTREEGWEMSEKKREPECG